MATIEEAIRESRGLLLQEDAVMIRRLQGRYEATLKEIDRLLTTPGLRDEYRIAELAAVEQLIREQITGLLRNAYEEIERERRVVALQAAQDFEDAMSAAGYSVGFALDPRTNARILGAVESGSPLRGLMSQLSMDAGEAAAQALSTGVILRENPLTVARRLKDTLDATNWRLQTIARTEVLRAYRGSMRERMKESRVIEMWTWISARETKTCPMCWAMHGTQHNLDVEFASHPNCRCSQAPTPPNSQVDLGNGVEDFAELPVDQQREILGPAAYRAYSYGQLGLKDFVVERQDPKWGLVRSTASLKSILGETGAMYMRKPPVVAGGSISDLEKYPRPSKEDLARSANVWTTDAVNSKAIGQAAADILMGAKGATFEGRQTFAERGPGIQAQKEILYKAAADLLHAAQQEQHTEVLYRGVKVPIKEAKEKYAVGSIHDIPLTSTSKHGDAHETFGGKGEEAVYISMLGTKNGVDVEQFSTYVKEREVIVSGRFEVVEMRQAKPGHFKPGPLIVKMEWVEGWE